MNYLVVITLLLAMVGVASIVIIAIDFIFTIGKKIKEEEDSNDERLFDP